MLIYLDSVLDADLSCLSKVETRSEKNYIFDIGSEIVKESIFDFDEHDESILVIIR